MGFQEDKQQFATASIVFDQSLGMINLTLGVKGHKVSTGFVSMDSGVKPMRWLASDPPTKGLITGIVLNIAEGPFEDAAPAWDRIFSMISELDFLSSLTSSVSFKIKVGSCSRLSRLFFLTFQMTRQNQLKRS